jgi:protein-S-isoprenylcysteine O-methyltransferase Ste14
VTPQAALRLAWGIWVVSWAAAAAWSDQPVARPAPGRERTYLLVTIVGALLLFGVYAPRFAVGRPLWPLGRRVAWVMVALAVAGFLFAWWARVQLGRLWSSRVTRKPDHHVVDSGPYRVVRHPIYSGIILATLATAVLRDTLLGVVGALLMLYGWYLKARLEERFLRDELGPEHYDAYRARVPMLVPFTRR